MSTSGRILALDFGSKRIGLALSDPLRIFAKPLKVIPNNGFPAVLEALRAVIAEHSAGLVLVGMPYAIEGGNTPKTDETRAFADKLAAALETPVQTWDERYSTAEAVDEMIRLGYDWKQRREFQDAMAAAMILKSFLESQCPR